MFDNLINPSETKTHQKSITISGETETDDDLEEILGDMEKNGFPTPTVFVTIFGHSYLPYIKGKMNIFVKPPLTFNNIIQDKATPDDFTLIKLTRADHGDLTKLWKTTDERTEKLLDTMYDDFSEEILETLKLDRTELLESAKLTRQNLISIEKKYDLDLTTENINGFKITKVSFENHNKGAMMNKRIFPYDPGHLASMTKGKYYAIKMSFLNKTKQNPDGEVISVDIFQNLPIYSANSKSYTNMKDIVEYLYNKLKVRRLLLLDFTCSTIHEQRPWGKQTQEDQESYSRLDIYGGKKSRYRSRKSRKSTRRRQGRRTKKAIRKRN